MGVVDRWRRLLRLSCKLSLGKFAGGRSGGRRWGKCIAGCNGDRG